MLCSRAGRPRGISVRIGQLSLFLPFLPWAAPLGPLRRSDRHVDVRFRWYLRPIDEVPFPYKEDVLRGLLLFLVGPVPLFCPAYCLVAFVR